MQKTILGHIDCPTCGGAQTMRITHDKNTEPFGYCETNCRQQLRIGGDPYRVKKFIEKFPWAGAPVAVPVTVTKPEPVAKKPPEAPKIPVTVTEPEKAAKPVKRDAFSHALAMLGGGK